MMLGGEVLNVLRWTGIDGDRRRAHPPRDVQPFAAFLGHDVPVISPAELEHTAFTEGHLRGSRPVGYRSPSAIPVEVRHQLQAGERFVYAYYGGIDKTAHERGFGEYYDAELRAADRLVGDVLEVLPPGAVLLLTADHGQVQVGDRIVDPAPDLLDMVAAQSGEGRFRWWHARHGSADELAKAALERYEDMAWVVTREQTLDEHWFGPTHRPADARPPRRRRLGAPRPGQLPRPRRLGPVPAGLPARVADTGRSARAAARRRRLSPPSRGRSSR